MYSSGRFSPPSNRNSSFQAGGSNRQGHFHGSNVGGSSGNPFLPPSANSNTKFVPTKLISKSQSAAAAVSDFTSSPMKPPKGPEKPLTPYMRYSRKMWDKVRAANPESKLWDIGKLVGSMWRELPDQGKQIYFDEYELEKVEYEKSMKSYKASPAYIAFEQMSRNKSRPDKSIRSSNTAESGVYIQPVDEDDGEEHIALMQLVGTRYDRNQRLMLEIFSNSLVPDPRTVISGQRMTILKRQVKSLTTHQRKLEDELEQLETKFQDKKRSISESSQTFGVKLKKVCEEMPALDDSKFEEMVEKASAKLLQSYEDYKQKQRETVSVAEAVEIKPVVTSSSAPVKENSESVSTEIIIQPPVNSADDFLPPPVKPPESDVSVQSVEEKSECKTESESAQLPTNEIVVPKTETTLTTDESSCNETDSPHSKPQIAEDTATQPVCDTEEKKEEVKVEENANQAPENAENKDTEMLDANFTDDS